MENRDSKENPKTTTRKKKGSEWIAVYISIAALSVSFLGLYFQYFYKDFSVIAKVNQVDKS